MDSVLNINLNFMANPFKADRRARMYFKKNEFFLLSNSASASTSQQVELLPSDFDSRS